MVLDLTNPAHIVRLRVGDIGDLPLLPDSVYEHALTESNGKLGRAAQTCAGYILGLLAQTSVHQKLAQIEVWDNTRFDNYLKFLKTTILNPMMNDISPIPYAGTVGEENPIVQFQNDWNNVYVNLNETELLHLISNRTF